MSDMPSRRLVTTRLEFHAALREAFTELAQVGCREAWICDEDFADWPLNDTSVIDDLVRWAVPHRKLTVIARRFDAVVRSHPRWVDWRRQWSHVVDCKSWEDAEAGELPTMLLAPGVVTVRLFDPIHHRGSLSRDAGNMLKNKELIDAVSQRSVASFPATILGL
jgi:hypothetical protein